MDNQDQRKNRSLGNEHHGSHVCNRCGWPFPNPHPSPKHRRAHKKLCGTIEGYKLVDSDKDSGLAVSDDHGDNKFRTPNMDRSNSAKIVGGIDRAISTRSEDEVFADAAEEFPAAGLSPQVEYSEEKERIVVDVEKIMGGDSEGKTQLYCSSEEGDQMRNHEVSKSLANLPESVAGARDANKEDAAMQRDAKSGSVSDLCPLEPGVLPNSTEKSQGITARDDVMGVGLETELKSNKVGKPDLNTSDICLSELNSKSGEIEDISAAATNYSTAQLLVEDYDRLVLKPSEVARSNEFRYAAHENISGDTSQVNTNMDRGISPSESSMPFEDCLEKEVGNEHSISLSVPHDIPLVDHAEASVEGFKDHKKAKMHQCDILESYQAVDDKEQRAEGSAVLENCDGIKSGEPSIEAELSSFNMHVEDNHSHQCANDKAGVKELHVAGGSDVHEIKPTITEDAEHLHEIKMEKGLQDQSPLEQDSSDVYDTLHQNVSLDTVTEVLSSSMYAVANIDASANLANNSVGPDDLSAHASDMIGVHEIAGLEKNEFLKEGNSAERKIVPYESSGSHRESQIILVPTLVDENDANCQGKVKTETPEASDESLTENTRAGLEPSDETTINPLESRTTVFDTVGEFDQNLQKIECMDLDKVSGGPVVSEENMTDVDRKGERESVQAGCKATESYYDIDVKPSQENLEAHSEKVQFFSPLASEPLVLSSAAARDASGINPQLTKAAKHGTGPVDVSVGSSNENDNLEANYLGPVSVIPVQSDTAAAVDTEPENMKKPENESNGKNNEESDASKLSLLTVVEPDTEVSHTSDAQEVQTTHNPSSQPVSSSLQAGLFPSHTRILNELEGRKKNEEIVEKVTSLSFEKQHHVPLKRLLSEAKSPKQQDNRAAGENSSTATRVSFILGQGTSPEKGELDREWNSPATYPANIKREERKAKARPFWVPFVCCSSAN